MSGDLLRDAFSLWSVVSVPVTIMAGLAYAIVIHRVRPTLELRLVVFLMTCLAVFWYLPLLPSMVVAGNELAAARSVGQLALFGIFTATTVVALRVIRVR